MKRKRIALAAEVPEGGTVKFEFQRSGKTVPAFLARFRGRLVAYENICQHLPLSLDYDDSQFFTRDGRHFLCQNHGALYDPLNGLCVRGPCAGQSLRPLAIEEVEGIVYLKRR